MNEISFASGFRTDVTSLIHHNQGKVLESRPSYNWLKLCYSYTRSLYENVVSISDFLTYGNATDGKTAGNNLFMVKVKTFHSFRRFKKGLP